VKRIVRHFALLASMQALCFAAAFASDKVVEKPVAADTAQKFNDVAAAVRKEMQAGGRYEFIRADEKAKAETDLETMGAMLQKSGSASAMSEADQLKLFNTQEHLNGILSHSDANRLVCQKDRPVGSNIPVTTCKTFGEIERNRRDAQKYMQDSMQNGSRCSGLNCRGG